MTKYLGLLTFLIYVFGLVFVVWHWKGGLHMTFSQHVARYRTATVYYSTLFAVSLPLLYVFFDQWFVPVFNLSDWFIVFVIISSVFQILCTFIPEIGGRKTTVHRIFAGISAVALLPVVMIIALARDIPQPGRLIAIACLAGMAALLFVALRNPKGHRYSLLLQAGYYALFFVPVLYITYL